MPSTGESPATDGWRQLLDVLTVEELEQYGQMARDQISGEFRRVGAYVGVVVLSLLLAATAAFMLVNGGYGWFGYFALGLGLVLLYWPYRAIMTCRLWEQHYRAVRGELERRENEGNSGDA